MTMDGNRTINVLSDCIVSPLGFTSDANFSAVLEGRTCLKRHEGVFGVPEPFVASLFDRELLEEECRREGVRGDFTFFEKCMILSARKALEGCGVDPSSDRVLFVVSTTKGNVDILTSSGEVDAREYLHGSARVLASYFHNPNTPIVVSNACISGVCALIEAMRAIRSGRYDYAVVTGADCQSRFIVSGFQSFKALSDDLCRPFDATRKGLNLGEASATVVLGAEGGTGWEISDGVIRNDANHISGPSRTGEGSFRVLRYLMENIGKDELAFLNVHGTSTPYNDEMESIAIDRAGLSDVPVNALKGYYGHTMGAAGVLETIISMKAADAGIVLATKGYSECGVSCPVNVSDRIRTTDRKSFIKLLSGFGGCNAGVLLKKGGHDEY